MTSKLIDYPTDESKQQKQEMASKMQNPQMFVKCIEGKVHHTVSHRTELLLSPLAAAFKSIKMEAYTAKHPEAYAAMEDQIETLGYDDAVNTFQYCVENMYPSGPDKKEDFNEVCDHLRLLRRALALWLGCGRKPLWKDDLPTVR